MLTYRMFVHSFVSHRACRNNEDPVPRAQQQLVRSDSSVVGPIQN